MLKGDVLTTGRRPDPAELEATTPLRVVPARPQRSTISAIEMSRLCGVGRERLRTWERRHGFPRPARGANGVRRYYPEDVRRVVAVARMVDSGALLGEAIERIQSHNAVATTEPALVEGTLRDAAMPAIALTGPEPLTVAWTNAETAKLPDAPGPGDELIRAIPAFGAAAVSQLQRLMAGIGPECLVIEHADWVGTFPAPRRSLAWRAAPQSSDQPLVVVVQLPQEADRRAVDSIDEADGRVWGRAVADAARVLRDNTGLGSVQRALGGLVRSTGAIDGFFAVARAEELRAATSVRGLFPAGRLAIGPNDQHLDALRAGQIDWLPTATSRELGAMPCSALLALPLVAGGSTLGAVFVAYPRELPLGDAAREQLEAFSLLLAMALQREQLRGAAPVRASYADRAAARL